MNSLRIALPFAESHDLREMDHEERHAYIASILRDHRKELAPLLEPFVTESSVYTFEPGSIHIEELDLDEDLSGSVSGTFIETAPVADRSAGFQETEFKLGMAIDLKAGAIALENAASAAG